MSGKWKRVENTARDLKSNKPSSSSFDVLARSLDIPAKGGDKECREHVAVKPLVAPRRGLYAGKLKNKACESSIVEEKKGSPIPSNSSSSLPKLSDSPLSSSL